MYERLLYFARKLRRAWQDRTLFTKVGGFLFRALYVPAQVMVWYARLSPSDRRLPIVDGFADHRGKPEHHRSRPDDVRRIIAAYKKAKADQSDAAEEFQIRGLWAEWLEVNYSELCGLLVSEDIAGISSFFENMMRDPCVIGTGGTFDEYNRYRHSLYGAVYIKTIWARSRDRLRSIGFDPAQLRSPLIGNPAGISIGTNLLPIGAFPYSFRAVQMRELLGERGGTIVEIGGGMGGQLGHAVRILDRSVKKYLNFDIPEVVTLASYQVLSAFPDKRVRLYGEGPLSVADDEPYDIGLFPHFTIPALKDDSVDLFYNSNSFSEMDGHSSTAYLRIIERACRRYFKHANHDTTFKFRNADGSTSENVIGSKLIPDPTRFKRLEKKPREFALPEDRLFPSYEYLYVRTTPDPN